MCRSLSLCISSESVQLEKFQYFRYRHQICIYFHLQLAPCICQDDRIVRRSLIFLKPLLIIHCRLFFLGRATQRVCIDNRLLAVIRFLHQQMKPPSPVDA